MLLTAACSSPTSNAENAATEDKSMDDVTEAGEDSSKIYLQVVEDAIAMLGVDPVETRGDEEGKWSLENGGSKVWVDCWYIEKEGRYYTQVMSPVFKYPEDQLCDISRELLTVNDKLYQCSFTLYNDYVWLKTIREAKGLDKDECYGMITRIGNYAEQYTKEFKVKYNLPD